MHRYTAGRPSNVSVANQCVNVVNLLRPKRQSRFEQSPSLLKVRYLVGLRELSRTQRMSYLRHSCRNVHSAVSVTIALSSTRQC